MVRVHSRLPNSVGKIAARPLIPTDQGLFAFWRQCVGRSMASGRVACAQSPVPPAAARSWRGRHAANAGCDFRWACLAGGGRWRQKLRGLAWPGWLREGRVVHRRLLIRRLPQHRFRHRHPHSASPMCRWGRFRVRVTSWCHAAPEGWCGVLASWVTSRAVGCGSWQGLARRRGWPHCSSTC